MTNQDLMRWQDWWRALPEERREFYRHKAGWEGMGLIAVTREWPDQKHPMPKEQP